MNKLQSVILPGGETIAFKIEGEQVTIYIKNKEEVFDDIKKARYWLQTTYGGQLNVGNDFINSPNRRIS